MAIGIKRLCRQIKKNYVQSKISQKSYWVSPYKKGLGTHIKLSRAFSKAGRYLTTSQWMSFGGRFTCYYTKLCQIKKEEEDDEIH